MRFAKRQVRVDGAPSVYRVYAPRTDTPLPVILFLHGAGELGSDGFAQTTVGIGPSIRRNPDRYPALVVLPQASRGYGWRDFNLDCAVAALDDAERAFHVDRDRVYVTGLSMGGYGAWLLAVQQPERFAAVVPVCGGYDRKAAGMPIDEGAARIAAIPQWVFHGDADDIIAVDESRRMVNALLDAGADVRYTEYPGVMHNSWDRAYAEGELMPWLLGHRRTL